MRFRTQVIIVSLLGFALFVGGSAEANTPHAAAATVPPAGAATKPHLDASHEYTKHGAHGIHSAPPVNWTDIGYGDKNIHGGKLEKHGDPMAPPLIFALFNFAIFAGLLYWKAGPPLSKYLANRHDSIKGALEEAARLQADAKKKLAEYSRRISDADAEVAALIEQIRADAEAERAFIVADAEQQAQRMRKDAEARIETEFLAARRRLEREIIAKAADTAEKLLTTKASPAIHDALFTSFIKDLKAQKSTQATRGTV